MLRLIRQMFVIYMKRRISNRPSRSSASSSTASNNCATELNWEPLPPSLSCWTGFVLHWVADLGEQFFTNTVAPLGLRPNQVVILQLLASEGPIVQARLSDKLRVDKATMVNLLNELESQGLIERQPHRCDRRAFEVHILEAGLQRLQEAEKVSIAATKHFFGALTLTEQQTLHNLLSRLATSNAPLVPPSE